MNITYSGLYVAICRISVIFGEFSLMALLFSEQTKPNEKKLIQSGRN